MEAPMEKLITELKEGLGVGGPCSNLKDYMLLDSLVSMLQEVNEHQKTFIQQNYVSHADHEKDVKDAHLRGQQSRRSNEMPKPSNATKYYNTKFKTMCSKCSDAFATHGIGETKVVCGKCWNELVTHKN